MITLVNRYSTFEKYYSGGASSGRQQSAPQLTPAELAQQYQTSLPGVLGTTLSQSTPTATSLANAANAANPIYTQGVLNQLGNSAGGYQQAGADLSTQQALSQAGLIGGAGGLTAAMGTGLVNALNPTQALSNTQAQNLLNSINLNGLSGGEQAAIERSLGQSNYATGNLGIDNATNAVSNAMNFGQGLQAKRAALGSALNTAGGVAANQNTFAQPLSTALNSGNVSGNFGLGLFNPSQGNSTLTAPLTFGSSIFSPQATNASSQISSGSNASHQGGISCFLTTACCEYKGLPDDCKELTVLRKFRDEHVPAELTNEYYRIAPEMVKKINGDKQKLEYIWEIIQDCVAAIEAGYNQLAIEFYKGMVEILRKELCLETL